MILLAHTNKNRNGDGKVVFGGTSDIVDDVDCAYTLDEISCEQGKKRVLFENIKARGDVDTEAVYSYSTATGQSYEQRLNSIEQINQDTAEKAKQERWLNEWLEKDKPVINAILAALEQGDTLKTNLVNNVHRNYGFSNAQINKVLAEHTGSDYAKGHRWFLLSGHKNAKIYSRLNGIYPPGQARVETCQAVKQGGN
ncbi:C1 family peptidase [Methylocucumis oryzae]|uniref:C1 family peptidase n=1 Tax=Methylocucumis oryzae TaxID=1632867 RepID=UPI0012FF07BC|nr:C1 family peptidase [Methylocucumis oryzae]